MVYLDYGISYINWKERFGSVYQYVNIIKTCRVKVNCRTIGIVWYPLPSKEKPTSNTICVLWNVHTNMDIKGHGYSTHKGLFMMTGVKN